MRNLYIYFWRWATWKVFGDGAKAPQSSPDRKGIVCFITVAGFLNGPGFEAMRADLRGTADEIWVIDCSPEGHQPVVATRIFQAVQQPVCIVLAARTAKKQDSSPASVYFTALPPGPRGKKFQSKFRKSFSVAADRCWAGSLPRVQGLRAGRVLAEQRVAKGPRGDRMVRVVLPVGALGGTATGNPYANVNE